LRKDRTSGRDNYFKQVKRGNRLENRNAQGSGRLDGRLMAQMTIRAIRVIRGIGMMPVADDTSRKDQERDQRQGNSEYADRLTHSNAVHSDLVHDSRE